MFLCICSSGLGHHSEMSYRNLRPVCRFLRWLRSQDDGPVLSRALIGGFFVYPPPPVSLETYMKDRKGELSDCASVLFSLNWSKIMSCPIVFVPSCLSTPFHLSRPILFVTSNFVCNVLCGHFCFCVCFPPGAPGFLRGAELQRELERLCYRERRTFCIQAAVTMVTYSRRGQVTAFISHTHLHSHLLLYHWPHTSSLRRIALSSGQTELHPSPPPLLASLTPPLSPLPPSPPTAPHSLLSLAPLAPSDLLSPPPLPPSRPRLCLLALWTTGQHGTSK